MLKIFLEEVVVLAAGKAAEPIADLLNSKKHVNEFIIAKKLDLTINQTRNILYKISDFGLVSSMRKKDKKKGWYTYFWKIEILKALEFLKVYVEKKMEQFNNQINSRETKTFYICERCNLEFNEENAMHQEFACPECGEVLSLKDNSKLVRELKKNYDKFKEKLNEINKEIDIENEKLNKEREKEIKKVKKEKDDERALKRANRKILASKEVKEKPEKKKSVKKKTSKKGVSKKPAKKKTAIKKAAKKTPVKKKSAKKTSKK
jgi:transcription factor E